MSLQEGGCVPFWITPQEHVDTKFGQYEEKQLKDTTKYELLVNLKTDGLDIYVVKGKRVCEMQYIPHKNSIFVTNRISK